MATRERAQHHEEASCNDPSTLSRSQRIAAYMSFAITDSITASTSSTGEVNASHAVFAITELLIGILVQLPMRDLLLDQRVCRKWHEVITESHPLQEALFFRPKTPTSAWRIDYASSNKLVRIELAPDNVGKYPTMHYGGRDGYDVMLIGELNPMLFCTDQQWQGRHSIDRVADDGSEQIKFRKWPLSSNPEANSEAASWRKMLVVQPPVYCYIAEKSHPHLPGRSRKLKTNGTAEALAVEMAVGWRNWRESPTTFRTRFVLYLSEEEREMETISRT